VSTNGSRFWTHLLLPLSLTTQYSITIKGWWRGIQVASCETESGLTRSLQAGQNDVLLCNESSVPCACETHLAVWGRLTRSWKQVPKTLYVIALDCPCKAGSGIHSQHYRLLILGYLQGGGVEVKFCVMNWKGLRRSYFIGLYILSACWPEMIDKKFEDERFHV